MPAWQCYVAPVLLTIIFYYETLRYRDFFQSLDFPSIVQFLGNRLLSAFQFPQIFILPGYLLFFLVGTLVIPGYEHHGAPLIDGTRPVYKLNGFRLLILALATFLALSYYGLVPLTLFYTYFSAVFLQANLAAFALSTWLFVRAGRSHFSEESSPQSRRQQLRTARLFDSPPSENWLLEFWLGRELMPYALGVPLKLFWLKPSMSLWLFINISFAAKQCELYGTLSTSMLLYQMFVAVYVFDYFFLEHYMTSTWDIIAEKFGLMLVWGDLVFIPFVFSLQCWFLLHDMVPVSALHIVACVCTFVVGYALFRGSNHQKHWFKHHPDDACFGVVPVAIGGRLLVSGFWGLARHVNYLGDIVLGIAYSLPCGLSHGVLPWVYPLYLTLLLVHREVRDERKCAQKYGELWGQYVARVPYRIVPFVY